MKNFKSCRVTHTYIQYTEKSDLKKNLLVPYLAVLLYVFMYPIALQKHAKGQDLFDQIVYHLDLVETDYFGLQFLDSAQVAVCIPLIHFSTD